MAYINEEISEILRQIEGCEHAIKQRVDYIADLGPEPKDEDFVALLESHIKSFAAELAELRASLRAAQSA